ncbi:MAG: hypothetical protein LBB56_04560 [Chitinispirillales bacterium]|jgi:uncharacterized protein (DUF697 family)|nr:hypothetical protein [Chitinispirillales bacterium]
MSTPQRIKWESRIAIGIFSTAAATWSAATAAVPVVGPVLADTAGLTLISIGMAYSLSAIYKKNIATGSLAAFTTVVLGAVFGTAGLKAAASLIPIFGSGVNAAITATLHAATGWAICKVYDSGGELSDITIKDIKACKNKAKEELANYQKAFNNLSPQHQNEINELQKKLRNKDLSAAERDRIDRRIYEIFGMNGV